MLSRTITDRLLDLPRHAKRLVALSMDGALCAVSVWVAFYLRLGFWPHPFASPLFPLIAALVLALPIFISFGLYRAIFRYSGADATVAIFRAVILYAIPFALIFTMVGIPNVPRTIGIIQPILLFLFVGGSRVLARLFFQKSYTDIWRKGSAKRVLIYGAGKAGRELASAISVSREMRLVGFVDDEATLWGSTLFGAPILSPASLPKEVLRREVTDILLAIPSATRSRRKDILAELRSLSVHVQTLPSVMDIASGRISVSDLREPDIEDLLGRSAVSPDEALLQKNIQGRTIMVTGAGGSIGSELCRQILMMGPSALLLVDHAEFNLYTIHQELTRKAAQTDDMPTLVPLLASVGDSRRIKEIISGWKPSTIIHAAAYKHVPLVEHNAVEGIRNNVFGTLNLVQIAREMGVANFTLISTDKAVRPTNIMGATKRLAEMILQGLNHLGGSKTTLSMVRFGNVLGSSGSVIPLFRQQIANGGPITITHREVTRFFMTIPEAAQLVLQAGAMAEGGDVFVLDMGEPVLIADLARNMIELSGLSVRDAERPDGDIAIEVTGLRPGEKLYEELLIGEDPRPSGHPRILYANEKFLPWAELDTCLAQLQVALDKGDAAESRDLLSKIVVDFKPNSDLVDLTRR